MSSNQNHLSGLAELSSFQLVKVYPTCQVVSPIVFSIPKNFFVPLHRLWVNF